MCDLSRDALRRRVRPDVVVLVTVMVGLRHVRLDVFVVQRQSESDTGLRRRQLTREIGRRRPTLEGLGGAHTPGDEIRPRTHLTSRAWSYQPPTVAISVRAPLRYECHWPVVELIRDQHYRLRRRIHSGQHLSHGMRDNLWTAWRDPTKATDNGSRAQQGKPSLPPATPASTPGDAEGLRSTRGHHSRCVPTAPPSRRK